jgi:CRISP-associated protein Cas1
MRTALNTLFVQTEPAYIHLDHDTVRVEVDRETRLRVPLLQIEAIVCFGNVLVSPAMIHRCADDGRPVVWLDRHGRFKARVEGANAGNVLLRRAQHLALDDADQRVAIARAMVAGKLRNSRHLLLRGSRDAIEPGERVRLQLAAEAIAGIIRRLPSRVAIEEIRGDEGEAAAWYFDVFESLVRGDRDVFGFPRRTRRPPLDPMNALLSFLYTMLRIDCVSALEGVGLDPRIGYMHALRPGRPALALDLMEEIRPVLADRLALSLINRRQLGRDDFTWHEGGAVLLNEQGRKTVLVALQKRKLEEVDHPAAGGRTPLALLPHLQARILARHLRGDLSGYLPWLAR